MTDHYSILIVDDDDNLRHTLGIILERAGFIVKAANSGQNAMRELKQFTFDLILLDFDLLDGSGRVLLSLLRQSHSRTPVVVLTGQNYPNLAAELRQLGVRGCLRKPVAPECILAQVCALLRQGMIPDSAADGLPGSKILNGPERPVANGRAPTEPGVAAPPSQSEEEAIA